MLQKLFFTFFIIIFSNFTFGYTVSIIADSTTLSKTMIKIAVNDVSSLLMKGGVDSVYINNSHADIQLKLPNRLNDSIIGSPLTTIGRSYPVLQYPEHSYIWESKQQQNAIVLTLQTSSSFGITSALYGLLQERLGYCFYHPKETIIPDISQWPLPTEYRWSRQPRFLKKGFHLHTQHPIELTEQLMNPEYPQGLSDVKEYIDWLARNSQNYFEFSLLESIDTKTWIPYSKKIVDYCHNRGVLAGVEISINFIQQKAFKLIDTPFLPSRNKDEKAVGKLIKLLDTPWDVINLEASSTEFTGNSEKRKEQLFDLFNRELIKRGVKLVSREHVVKKSSFLINNKDVDVDTNRSYISFYRGVFIHSVMCYSLCDSVAPVYGNSNFAHLDSSLKNEMKKREVWYYPESAYWVNFDNSIPLFLLSYFQARYDDIIYTDSLGVDGHVTFSSGWEWGYSLIDWSIARWSWKDDTSPDKNYMKCITGVFNDSILTTFIDKAYQLQNKYVKEYELLRYITIPNPIDEFYWRDKMQYQPRPFYSSHEMRYTISEQTADSLIEHVVYPLMKFAGENYRLIKKLKWYENSFDDQRNRLLLEITESLEITGKRAEHRARTLHALLLKREAELNNVQTKTPENLLNFASHIRYSSQLIVNNREKHYRYPRELIATHRYNYTAYDYGYLYTVSDLFFWFREESQIREDIYALYFMLIWDLPRIIGLVD